MSQAKDSLLAFREKHNMNIERPEPQIFSMNDIKHKMLVWNTRWLEEQQNQQVKLSTFY